MNSAVKAAIVLVALGFGSSAHAYEYNDVPAGSAQYAACLNYSATQYTGGSESSPISGQTKAQAWCTCMYNETPEGFKGNLAKFSETAKGKATNRTCEKYADWGN